MKETLLAKELLNAVYEEDSARVKKVLLLGADPSWVFNGYPILIHAVYLQNLEVMMTLVHHGAKQLSEALGFALEQGLGDMVWPLAFMGVVPKAVQVKECFGTYPARFVPTTFAYVH